MFAACWRTTSRRRCPRSMPSGRAMLVVGEVGERPVGRDPADRARRSSCVNHNAPSGPGRDVVRTRDARVAVVGDHAGRSSWWSWSTWWWSATATETFVDGRHSSVLRVDLHRADAELVLVVRRSARRRPCDGGTAKHTSDDRGSRSSAWRRRLDRLASVGTHTMFGRADARRRSQPNWSFTFTDAGGLNAGVPARVHHRVTHERVEVRRRRAPSGTSAASCRSSTTAGTATAPPSA